MKSYHDAQVPLILAHRGGPGEALENTLEAFQHAVDLGFNYLETDVRATNDGTLYLCHSPTSLLPNRPLKQRSELSLLTLRQLFVAFPNCYFLLDPKHNRAVEPLARLIVEFGLTSNVCIGSSFDTRTKRTAELIAQLSGTRPCTALVSATAIAKLLLNNHHVRIAQRDLQADYIHIPAKLLKRSVIRSAHSLNLKIIAWVLNNKRDMEDALSLGADGFMTDFPTIATKLINQPSRDQSA